MLMLIPLFWGPTWFLTDFALDAVASKLDRNVASAFIMFVRCLIPALCYSIFHFQSLLQKEGWQYGPMLGVPKALTLLLSAYALEFALPDATAFVFAMVTPLTVLLKVIVTQKCASATVWFGCTLATIGAVFICGPPDTGFNWGIILTMLSAFFYAVAFVLCDQLPSDTSHSSRATMFRMSITAVQLVVMAAACGLATGIFCSAVDNCNAKALGAVLTVPSFAIPCLLMGVVTTGLGESIINTYQPQIGAVRAALIFALEPVVAFGVQLIAKACGVAEPSTGAWAMGSMVCILVGVVLVIVCEEQEETITPIAACNPPSNHSAIVQTNQSAAL
jgi:drug/metabolite transporter (DMT)-like permease